MIAPFFSLEELELLLRRIRKGILLLWLLFLSWGALTFFQKEEMEISYSQVRPAKPTLATWKIERNFFSEVSEKGLIAIPDLSKMILFLGKNPRPDRSCEDNSLLFVIPSTGEKGYFLPEDSIYLSYEGKHRLIFSKEVTPLKIKPFFLSDGRVKLQALLRFFSEDGELFVRDERDFILTQSRFEEESWQHSHPALGMFSQAELWEPDKIYELFEDNNFHHRKRKWRLELCQKTLFVKEGDRLVFKEGKWKLVEPGEETVNYPLAEVVHAAAHRLDFALFDERGISSVQLSLGLRKQGAPQVRIDDFFGKISRRTAKTVSLKCKGKSTFLKEGDWIKFEEGEFRLIRNRLEKASLLESESKCELFVFEKIGEEDHSLWFNGYFFSPHRKSYLPVKLPIVGRSKSKSAKKRALEKKYQKVLHGAHG